MARSISRPRGRGTEPYNLAAREASSGPKCTAAALFLAAVGLYGVMAFSVNSRTQEMGVRMALGASARDVIKLVLSKGMKQLAIGGLIGLAMGAALAQPLSVAFFEVKPSDPTVYAAIIITLGLAGLFACIIPARRATQVELVEALQPD